MDIVQITEKAEWEQDESEGSELSFLQSFEWGVFQEDSGKEVVRIRMNQTSQNIQGFVHDLGCGIRYLYVPRVSWNSIDISALRKFAKKQRYVFVRVEPLESTDTVYGTLTHARQPQQTLQINVQNAEDELLSAMHQKTRYNIRLAEKKGVTVKEEKNIDVFWKLHSETAARDTFRGHKKVYYKKMLDMPIAHQLTAYLDDEPVASNIYMVYGNTCTYLHGASSNKHRNTMAPYLLQWKGMQLAKKNDSTSYDMWGVAPEVKKDAANAVCSHSYCWDKDHAWSGITRFKVGFGGKPVVYPRAQDIVTKPFLYKLYSLAKLLRTYL